VWLASVPDRVVEWSSSGLLLEVCLAHPWFCTLPEVRGCLGEGGRGEGIWPSARVGGGGGAEGQICHNTHKNCVCVCVGGGGGVDKWLHDPSAAAEA
jgi:hypothetical protein